MRRSAALSLGVLLFCGAAAFAQFTTVSGTVTDPNSLPYAFGTIVPTLVSSATPKFTASNLAYTPPTQPVGLNSAGSFIVQLADNTLLTPGGSNWTFTVCSAVGSVPFSFGKGPVCFTVTAVTISGASQDIGATLRAAAPALTLAFSGTGTVGGSGTGGFMPVWTNSSTLGNSLIQASTNPGALIQLGAPGNALTGQTNVSVYGQDTSTCAGTATVPLPLIVCYGFKVQRGTTGASGIGQSAAGVFLSSSNGSTQALMMGVYGSVQGANAVTEERAGYFEAYDNVGTAITGTRRAIFAFAGNGSGNTTAVNDAIVAQTSVAAGTNTSDSTIHVLSPIVTGTMSAHAGVTIEDQIVGNSLTVNGARPSVFGGVVNGVSGFQQNGTPLGINCGTSAACSNTAAPLVRIVYGQVTLTSGTPSTVTVTGISPAFTSTTSYECSADNATTQANSIKVANTSTSSVTFTGANTTTDVVEYVCVGT